MREIESELERENRRYQHNETQTGIKRRQQSSSQLNRQIFKGKGRKEREVVGEGGVGR